jgi:predicted nucleic acid-binding protein
VVSELVRARPSRRVVDWVAAVEEHTLFLSVLTLGELHKGIAKLGRSSKRMRLEQWVEQDLVARFRGRIVPITLEIAIRWGALMGSAEARGEPLPVIDALLAATAITGNLAVVTRDTTDIARSGASVVNPWSA